MKSIDQFAYYKLQLSEYHNWLNNYVTNILTAARAALLGMTADRAQLMEINDAMSDAGVAKAAYPETAQIEHDWGEIVSEAQKLLLSLAYFSDDTATAAEKAAAQVLLAFVDPLHGISEKTVNQCIDAARDVSRELLKHQSDLTAIRQLARVQHIQTLTAGLVTLIDARDARRLIRSSVNAGSELRPLAEPIRKRNYDDFDSLIRRGTADEKAAVSDMIDEINAFQINLGQVIAHRETTNAKKKGEEKPEHKPDKPSNRPEGPYPNEDGDEPGGDSGDDNNGSDNNGGDSGDGNNGSDNNGGDSGGGNNNGGSDKPPNPEEPD